MSRLNAYGIRTYLTSENGMVHLYFKDDQTWLKTAKKG